MLAFTTDYHAIVSGNVSPYSRVYREAAEETENKTPKGMARLKAFAGDIEKVSSKSTVRDSRITASRGNLEKFSAYDSIQSSISFLQKNLSTIELLPELVTIRDEIMNCSQEFQDGYTQKCKLVQLEYESAVFLLVTGLSLTMAAGMDVQSNGTEIRIVKKQIKSNGSTVKMVKDLAKIYDGKDHRQYLKAVLKAGKEPAPVNEAGEVLGVIQVVDSIMGHLHTIVRGAGNIFRVAKNTALGIIPLIRSIMYHHYQKKADAVANLELQAALLEENMAILNNRTNVDPEKKKEILEKQQAYVEKYRKKAEKIRAQICEMEKDAVTEMKKNEPSIQNASGDDFVLESVGLKGSE